MTVIPDFTSLIHDIQHNCDLSDARDHGVYSMCTMVLKLRNQYKWENGLEPWEEPESADLLSWIDAKEGYWETIAHEPYRFLPATGRDGLDPLDPEAVNCLLGGSGLFYGAGFGRSLKAVFFLAEVVRRLRIEGCPVVVLGKERAREMASPFALVQDGAIIIRREALRSFFWDQILEVRSSCRMSLQQALQVYGVVNDGVVNRPAFIASLDVIVDSEMYLFIAHEVGEILQTDFPAETLQAIIAHFPGSVLEFVGRAVKDLLADTHPHGPLCSLVTKRRESSLGFYVSFLDGLREKLFPEIVSARQRFLADGQWDHIEAARRSCWERNRRLAEQMRSISAMIGRSSDDRLVDRFNSEILAPLGLERPPVNMPPTSHPPEPGPSQ